MESCDSQASLYSEPNVEKLNLVNFVAAGSFGNVFLAAPKGAAIPINAAILQSKPLSYGASLTSAFWHTMTSSRGLGVTPSSRDYSDCDVDEIKVYAVKRISKGHLEEYCRHPETGLLDESLRSKVLDRIGWERECQEVVCSPFIIHLYASWQDYNFLYMLQEVAACDLGDLIIEHEEIFAEDRPRGSNSQFFVACLTLALEHMHERRIAHRDLKLENILLGHNGCPKLCDFGMAKFILGKTYTHLGTPEFMAPEIIDGIGHGLEVDWWALGVITFELLAYGQLPWEHLLDDTSDVNIVAIRASQATPNFKAIPSSLKVAKEFISKLLCMKVATRMGTKEGNKARDHPWFKVPRRIDFERLRRKDFGKDFEPPYLPKEEHTAKWSPGRRFDSVHENDENFTPLKEPCPWESWPEMTCGMVTNRRISYIKRHDSSRIDPWNDSRPSVTF
jgi:serine/threonine protein kinase